MQIIIDFIRAIFTNMGVKIAFISLLVAVVAAIASQCGVPSPL